MIIGRNFLTKINANIGNSAVTSSVEGGGGEDGAGRSAGAPTRSADLPRGAASTPRGEWIIKNAPVPIGTGAELPGAGESAIGAIPSSSNWEVPYRDTLIGARRQQGVTISPSYGPACRVGSVISIPTAAARDRHVSRILGSWRSGAWRITKRASCERFEETCEIMALLDVRSRVRVTGLLPGDRSRTRTTARNSPSSRRLAS